MLYLLELEGCVILIGAGRVCNTYWSWKGVLYLLELEGCVILIGVGRVCNTY